MTAIGALRTRRVNPYSRSGRCRYKCSRMVPAAEQRARFHGFWFWAAIELPSPEGSGGDAAALKCGPQIKSSDVTVQYESPSHTFLLSLLSFDLCSFPTKSSSRQSRNEKLPPLVTMPHACSLAMTIEYLPSSILVRFIPLSRRLTTHTLLRRRCLGQICS